MKRQNVRTLSLIVCTFTYLLIGAAMFDMFESGHENEENVRFSKQAEALRKKYNMTVADFDFITQLGIQMKPYKAGTQWKFAGAFYFATTVITTIGYGHSTPKTMGGKIFCMFYAIPGIPLCLVMFQSIGERMNTIITWILKQLKRTLSCRCQHISQTNLMVVSFTTGATVLSIGAAVFSSYEDWSYLNSFYYCFITLTTIGFGDFVALQRKDSLAKRPDYVAFSLIFILFGLTVVSSVMNLLVLRFLTMNTEDERRDQWEAAVQAHELQRLKGDVICTDTTYPDPYLYHSIYHDSGGRRAFQLANFYNSPISQPTNTTMFVQRKGKIPGIISQFTSLFSPHYPTRTGGIPQLNTMGKVSESRMSTAPAELFQQADTSPLIRPINEKPISRCSSAPNEYFTQFTQSDGEIDRIKPAPSTFIQRANFPMYSYLPAPYNCSPGAHCFRKRRYSDCSLPNTQTYVPFETCSHRMIGLLSRSHSFSDDPNSSIDSNVYPNAHPRSIYQPVRLETEHYFPRVIRWTRPRSAQKRVSV